MTDVATVWVRRRWTDLDAQGHVNNTRVLDYLQEAVTRHLLATVPHLLDEGCVVVSNQVEYLHPIRFAPIALRVDMVVAELGAARFAFDFVIWDGDVRAARGRMTLCPFSFAAQLPRWLLPDERAALGRNLAGEDAVALGFTPMRDVVSATLGAQGVPFALWTRWTDVDRYGHVNNVRLFDYVQEARIAVMGQVDPALARMGTTAWDGASQSDLEPMLWLLVRQDVAYLGQVTHRLEPYEMRTACAHIGTTSMTLVAELVDPLADDAVLARATSVLVCADASGRPVPLSPRMRAVLTAGGIVPESLS